MMLGCINNTEKNNDWIDLLCYCEKSVVGLIVNCNRKCERKMSGCCSNLLPYNRSVITISFSQDCLACSGRS